MSGLLAGVRVLDLTHVLAGPFAALALADLGADVIRVEDVDHLDEARSTGAYYLGGESYYYLSLNWGKRSLGVRIGDARGRQAVLDVARDADVVIDNYRPGVLAKIGLDHDSLAAVNPRIITCSVTGFGETGPYATRPGYDYTIQALTGVMSVTGDPDRAPGKAGISYVDHAGGLAAALAVCAALVERSTTGAGRHIDLALLDVQVSMLTYLAAWERNAGYTAGRTADASHPSIVPAQNFATLDGHVSVFVGNDAMWRRCAEVLGDQRLDDQRFATGAGRSAARDILLPILGEVFARRTAGEWAADLSAAGVSCAPVNTIGQALEDEQVVARGLVETASHPAYGRYLHAAGPIASLGTAGSRGAPPLGADSVDVLRSAGYGDARIRELLEAGVVVGPVAGTLDVLG